MTTAPAIARTDRPTGVNRAVITASSLTGMLIVWELISLLVGGAVLPGPIAVGGAVADAARQSQWWSDVAVTLGRMAAAFVLGLACSVVFGVVLGLFDWAERFFGPWLTVAASVPALVVVFVCYVGMGISDQAAISAVSLVITPTMTAGIRDGVKAADPRLAEMARSFHATGWLTIRAVVVPQIMPWLFTTVRTGWSLTWRVMIFVELIGQPNGVGYRIQYWFDLANMTRVIAVAVPLIAVIVVLDFAVLNPLERRAFRYRPVQVR